MLDENPSETFENMLVYNILYKLSTGPKPLGISFDKIDEPIRVLDGKMEHLVLFYHELFDKICDRIKYRLSEKRVVADRKIRISSYNSLPI